jgi:hypothetical protein
MALFPMARVLRGFLPSTYSKYASDKNPCAALPIEKIAHLETENLVFKILNLIYKKLLGKFRYRNEPGGFLFLRHLDKIRS